MPSCVSWSSLYILDPRIAQYFYNQLVETLESSDWPILLFGTCVKLKDVSDGVREAALHEVILQVSFRA